MDVTSSGTPEDKLSLLFSLFDVDGNGWINQDEITNLMKCIQNMADIGKTKLELNESPEEKAQEIFVKMDMNSDGRVTKDEFIRACKVDQQLLIVIKPPST